MSKRLLSRLSRASRGNMAIIMAVIAPAFVGAVGLSVETGYWYYIQDRAQAAADVSAYTGAMSLRKGNGYETARSDARAQANTLGYTSPDASMSFNIPPTSGSHINAYSIEVIISYNVPRYFSSLFDPSQLTHDVRAVATYTPSTTACILALDGAASKALTLSGASLVNADGCEIMSNSVATDAVYISGSSEVTADCISSVGGVEESGGGINVTLTKCVEPKTQMPPASDPYEAIPEPDKTTPCTSAPATGTISAGESGIRRFCGGLSLNGTYDFEPGVYVVDGGDFRINAGSLVTGDDVTFYMTNGAEATWNGSAQINLAAPATGSYQGMLMIGDRSDTTAVHKFNGTVDTKLTGSIYAPASELEYLGDFGGANSCLQLIGARVTFLGTADITSACAAAGITWASVPGAAILVE